ncbi:ribosomal RNA-processing protein 7-domain-containing protein [Xylariaceae sp. FL0662B]|nr:ribosomal RNA-processing protein 7-domain-containing protein [Xylariaceae sp. FL0662B]
MSTSSDEFSVLPISIPPLPSFPVQAIHYLYLRRNAPKIATANDSRSLFLANIPCDSTEAHFRALFANLVGAGRFESANLDRSKKALSSHEPAQATRLAAHHKKRKRADEELQNLKEELAAELPDTWTRQVYRSGSSAVALFADEKSIELVLKAVKKLKKSKNLPVWGEGVNGRVPPLGSQWLKAHNVMSYPGNDVVQATMDAYFTTFNRKEQEAIQLAKRLRHEPDEDGFVTVARGGGRSAPARRDEAEDAKQKMLEKQQKKKDNTQDFYRFQMRERRKAEQAELLKRFDEDKKKVMAMKEKRSKFRPET